MNYCGGLKSIDSDEQKKVLLSMLIKVDEFCKKNNIRYFLDSGTLLGAIRHKGFIPWDDDVDICMPRPDYDRFLELTRTQMIDENLFVLDECNSLFCYVKICDKRIKLVEYPQTLRFDTYLYIDIFPKDGQPSSYNRAKKHANKVLFYCKLYWFNKYSVKVWKKSGNIFKKIIGFLAYPVCHDRLWPMKRAIKLAKKYPYDSSEYISSLLAGGIRGRVKKECFSDYLNVEFSNHQFPAPIGYDVYLKELYSTINNGDYMSLPPESKRIRHQNEIYWAKENEGIEL